MPLTSATREFICQHGISCKGVAKRCAARGFGHAHDVASGLGAWHSA